MNDLKKIKITAHCIIKNEDKWIWFAIQSVLPFVEQILVFDTGSDDKTIEIVKSINSPKIIFEEKGPVDKNGLVVLRQEQINRTKTNWFLILDGDEIWPATQIERLIKEAGEVGTNIVALFNRTRNCIGDIYHFIPESSGNYEIAGIRGNLNTRLIRKKLDLKVFGTYPDEYFSDKNGPIQEQEANLKFVDCWYLHTSFLQRSSLNNKTSGSLGKRKNWEKGLLLQEGDLPKVFKMPKPEMVDDPFKKRSFSYESLATAIIPLRYIQAKIKK